VKEYVSKVKDEVKTVGSRCLKYDEEIAGVKAIAKTVKEDQNKINEKYTKQFLVCDKLV